MKDAKSIVTLLAPALLATALGASSARADDASTTATTSAASDAAGASDAGSVLKEIIVTANKRTQNAREVPVSIAVIGGADVTKHHIDDYQDITRAVPGIAFATGNGPGQDNISIRGVSSTVGNPTVAVYIDDVPIITPAGYEGMAQPKLIDLSQVEVLRGPQGTLYGASSEGGTIRFLTNQPQLNVFAGSMAATLSGTVHGGPNEDIQGVVNIPVIEDKFAIRAVAALTNLSGYIDNYSLSGALLKKGVNSETDGMVRISGKLVLDDDLTVTPSVFYQLQDANNSPTFIPSEGLYKQNKQVAESDRDQLLIPSVSIKKGLGFADLTSVSSYFARDISRVADGTAYNSGALAYYFLDPAYPQYQTQNDSILANVASPVPFHDHFRTITQEFRLASPAGDSRLKWVAGAFYSDQKWSHLDHELAPGFGAEFQKIYGHNINADPVLGNGDPHLWDRDLVWSVFDHNEVAQYSGFGQIDFDITPRIHASLGDRYVYAHETFNELGGGFFDLGGAGTLGTPYYQSADFSTSTPKASVVYDLLPTSTLYASAGKGFRLGGATTPNTNAACLPGVQQLGLASAPASYGPDQLWSYEVGVKSLVFDKTLSVNADAYDIEWSKIQQTIVIPVCGGSFNANVGDAQAYGMEIEIVYKPPIVPGLTLGLNVGAEHAVITSTTNAQTAAVGQDILFVPKQSATFSADYAWPISATMNGFVRGGYDWVGPSKGSFQVDNPNYNNPGYGVADLSIGVDMGGLELQGFVKNLTNDHTILQRPLVNTVVYGFTVRPLTVGLTVKQTF
jgi:iron complex outermembrane receptor protein